MYARIRAALASPNRSKKLSDYIYANLLFSLPVGVRRKLFLGQQYYCPICDAHIKNYLRLHITYSARYAVLCNDIVWCGCFSIAIL